MKSNLKTGAAAVKKTLLFLAVVSAVSIHSFAQVSKKPAPPKVQVPDPVKRMEKMMGKWEGNIHSETGPVVTKKDLKASFDFSGTFKNLAIKVTTRFEVVDTNLVTEGVIFIGYNAADNQLQALFLNDRGEAYDLVGKWTNDYNLNFSCKEERGGRQIGITLWLNIKIQDQLGYKMYTTIGDDMLITDEGILMKKKTEQPVKAGTQISPKK